MPIQGTPAEAYLTGVEPGQRCIPAPDEWPTSLAWHPAERALIVAATTPDGKVMGVQFIRLGPDGRKRKGGDGLVKKTIGRPSAGDAVVRLPPRSDSLAGWRVLDCAEGVETGLSAWAAEGAECHIGLGRLLPQPGRLNRILLDDDPPTSPKGKALPGRLEEWRAARLNVVRVTPFAEPRGHGDDLNTVLQTGGLAAVRARFMAARDLATCAPPRTLPTANLMDARAALKRTVRQFYSSRPGLNAPQILLAGQGGLGKTDAVGSLMADAIAQARAEGRSHRVLLMVPEHKVLGPAVEARYRKLGLSVARLQGRGDLFAAPDPLQPALCTCLDAIADAIRAGARPGQAVCSNGKQTCSAFAGCRYQAGLAAAAAADVVIVANNFLFEELPAAVRRNVGWVVVDESFTDRADLFREVTVESFGADALTRTPVLTKGEPDAILSSRLEWLGEKMQAACKSCPDDYPDTARLRSADLTRDLCAEAHKLTWRRKREPQMTPGMSPEARRNEALRCDANQGLPAIADAWQAAGDMLSDPEGAAGRLRLKTRETGRGTTRVLVVHGQRHIAEWLHEVPVLLLNHTAALEDVRRHFPRVVEHTPPAVAAPNARVRLVLGGFAKGTLARKRRKLDELHDLLAVQHLGDTLGIVTHKSTEPAFADLGARLAHHGAVAGDDAFRDVNAFAVIGAPSARPSVVAALAAARTGLAVPTARAIETAAPVLLTKGLGIAVPVRQYEHPAAQAVHAGIFGAALEQAAHRPRQILRTPDNPVQITIFGNAAPNLPIDSIVLWAEVRPDRLIRMIARRRVYANAADMTDLLPDLFDTTRAAEEARRRFGPNWGQRLQEIVGRDRRPWSRVRWQPKGSGQKLRFSWCPTAELPALRDEIESVKGELVCWMVEPFTAGRSREEARTPKKSAPSHTYRTVPPPRATGMIGASVAASKAAPFTAMPSMSRAPPQP